MSDVLKKIDELIEKPRWLIDIFPYTVPQKPDGRYFEVEEYFQKNREGLNQKFCNLLLKLYCYYDIWVSVGDKISKNPKPAELAKWIDDCCKGPWKNRDYMNLILPECNSMIILNGDDLYLILCNPKDEQMMELINQLSRAEGLFFHPVQNKG